MRLITKNSQFVVFDDFLKPIDFDLMLRYVHDEDYQSVHADKWQKVYRLSDGIPLAGDAVLSHKRKDPNKNVYKVYPINSGIDIFIDSLLSIVEELTEWVGKKDIDWEVFTARPFLFPQGTGLSWHSDHMGKTGSYTFYTHSYWNVQWGGELLVTDETTKNIDYVLVEAVDSPEGKVIGQHLDNSYENKKLIDVGLGQYIVPKPNRLVVIAGGNPHMINKVSSAAGDRVRCSISGFFLKQYI